MADQLDKKEMDILLSLRKNGRSNLTTISKNTGVPVSTIFDRIKANKSGTIKKFTCLLDFAKLGFGCRIHFVVKVKKEQRADIQAFLLKHQNVNAVYKINNGFDFLIEAVFRHVQEVEHFVEIFEEKFKVYEKTLYYVIEEIATEIFFADKEHIDLAIKN